MKRLKIVYLLLSPTFGMHQYTADLANRMSVLSEVTLVTIQGYPEDRYRPDFTVQTPITLSNTGLSFEGLQLHKLGKLKQCLSSLDPDLVHVTGPHLWNVAIIRFLRSQGIPVIHTIHDLDPHPGTRLGWLLHLWNKLIVKNSDHIVVHGDIYKQRLVSQGTNPEKVSAIPLLHLFLGYEKTAETLDLAWNVSYEPFMLFFGRLEPYKGIDNLLQAFGSLRQTGDTTGSREIRLIIAGDGPMPDGRHSELPQVEWRNHLIQDNEALDLFSRCMFLVLPYSQATQSALIAAAYYFRKPVVITSTGALMEYVVDGLTGYISEPKDPASLRKAMIRMLAEPSRAAQMGEAGRKWYDQRRIEEFTSLLTLYERYGPRISA